MNIVSLSDLHAHTVLVAIDELRKATDTSRPDAMTALAVINEADKGLRRQLPRQAVSVKVSRPL